MVGSLNSCDTCFWYDIQTGLCLFDCTHIDPMEAPINKECIYYFSKDEEEK